LVFSVFCDRVLILLYRLEDCGPVPQAGAGEMPEWFARPSFGSGAKLRPDPAARGVEFDVELFRVYVLRRVTS